MPDGYPPPDPGRTLPDSCAEQKWLVGARDCAGVRARSFDDLP